MTKYINRLVYPVKLIVYIILPLLVSCTITAQTIAEQTTKLATRKLVVEKIDSVVQQGKTTQSTVTYFAALYNTMLIEIQSANSTGHFTDSVLIDYIQKNFTSYYLNTLTAYNNNDSVPYAWMAALDTNYCKNCSYVQWLALGTNAHINHDLYFILLNYFNQFGTANHNAKKAQKEFFTISARETDRIVKVFIKTDPHISWLEGVLINSGKKGVKLQMKKYLRVTWNNALEAHKHPERQNAITQKQMAFARQNAQQFMHPKFPIKTGFKMMKSLDSLPFATKLSMLAPVPKK